MNLARLISNIGGGAGPQPGRPRRQRPRRRRPVARNAAGAKVPCSRRAPTRRRRRSAAAEPAPSAPPPQEEKKRRPPSPPPRPRRARARASRAADADVEAEARGPARRPRAAEGGLGRHRPQRGLRDAHVLPQLPYNQNVRGDAAGLPGARAALQQPAAGPRPRARPRILPDALPGRQPHLQPRHRRVEGHRRAASTRPPPTTGRSAGQGPLRRRRAAGRADARVRGQGFRDPELRHRT